MINPIQILLFGLIQLEYSKRMIDIYWFQTILERKPNPTLSSTTQFSLCSCTKYTLFMLFYYLNLSQNNTIQNISDLDELKSLF